MEFHGGGDFLQLLARHDDVLDESMAKFYAAEMVRENTRRLGWRYFQSRARDSKRRFFDRSVGPCVPLMHFAVSKFAETYFCPCPTARD